MADLPRRNAEVTTGASTIGDRLSQARLRRLAEAQRTARTQVISDLLPTETNVASGANRYSVGANVSNAARTVPSRNPGETLHSWESLPRWRGRNPSLNETPPLQKGTPTEHRFAPPAYLKYSGSYSRMLTNSLPGDIGALHRRVLLPTRWDTKKCCDLLDMTTDGLTVQFRGSGKNGERDAAAVKADRPMPPQCGVYYFEVEILSKGQSGYIGVGFSGPEVSLTRLPGWEDNSYGYHGDDGNSFSSQGTGGTFGPTFTTEDVVGCGIDWTTRRAFFTKNGMLIDFCFSDLRGELYPSVGLRTPGEVVKVNFGQVPFRFDIVDLSSKTAFHRAISHSDIPTAYLDDTDELAVATETERTEEGVHFQDLRSTLGQIVSNYLVHHGCSNTLVAFERERAASAASLADIAPTLPERPTRSTPLPKLPPEALASIIARRKIMNQIVDGHSGDALIELRSMYPAVVASDFTTRADIDKSIVFRLRCQSFLDMINTRSNVDDSMEVEEASPVALKSMQKRKASVEDNNDSHMDDTEDDSTEELLHLGQEIYKDYHEIDNIHTKAMLARMFSLLAYTDLSEVTDPALTDFIGDDLISRRKHLARAVNTRILESEGYEEQPALESIYRQTSVIIEHLAEKGKASYATVYNNNELDGD